MTKTKKKKPAKPHQILLEGELTISTINALLEKVKKAFKDHDSIEFKIGDYDSIDLTCLQLFCSAHRTALQNGKTLAIVQNQMEAFDAFRKKAGYKRHQGCRLNPTQSCLWCG